MELAALIATVMAVTQWLKTALEKVGVIIQGKLAVAFVILVSIGTVIYKAIETHAQLLSITTLWLLVQVIIGAIGGYGLIKVARNPNP